MDLNVSFPDLICILTPLHVPDISSFYTKGMSRELNGNTISTSEN